MEKRKIPVFFYGSYINMHVLKEIGLEPGRFEVARLDGYDIEINPIVNLFKSDKECVYGIVTMATHEELENLYEHARKVLGGNYLPEAVLVKTNEGMWVSALVYIANEIPAKKPTDEYITKIVEAGEEYGIPAWYLDKIETFRPA